MDLDEFWETCESCMGPKGRLKMIISSNGSLITTSASSRLWSLVQFDHPFAEFIIQAGRNLLDHRLYFASLTARLLRYEAIEVDRTKLCNMIEAASSCIDIGNIHHLVNVSRSMIKSKAKSGGLLNNEVNKISMKLVEAWLKSLPDLSDELGEVVIKVSEGWESGDPSIIKGLLYPHDPIIEDTIQDMMGPVKVHSRQTYH